jgi:hypothetical protein
LVVDFPDVIKLEIGSDVPPNSPHPFACLLTGYFSPSLRSRSITFSSSSSLAIQILVAN